MIYEKQVQNKEHYIEFAISQDVQELKAEASASTFGLKDSI